jgi:hypothetical protein
MSSPIASLSRSIAFASAFFGSSLSLAESPLPEPAAAADVRFELQIKERKVVGDEVIRVTQGQIVEMVWTTDEETNVHIHGYEIHIPVSPDKPAEVTFEAHATGRFPVTSHGFAEAAGKMHQMLLYFEVYPE